MKDSSEDTRNVGGSEFLGASDIVEECVGMLTDSGFVAWLGTLGNVGGQCRRRAR